MTDGAIGTLERRLGEATTSAAVAEWWAEARRRVAAEGARALPVLFPALARRLGRGLIGGGIVTEPGAPGGDALVDLDVWRVCDAAGLVLLRSAADLSDEAQIDLFLHGDFEERAILLRAMSLLPIGAATARLFAEVQRTNTGTHFEAMACDHDLPARACGVVEGFGADDLNRLVLKAAFLDLPLRRLFRVEQWATAELSRMLQDLATEREAAGRRVWADTDHLLGLAPTRGTILRLVGALEHGADHRRRLAAAALAAQDSLALPALVPLIRDRAEREPVAEIRDVLIQLADRWSRD